MTHTRHGLRQVRRVREVSLDDVRPRTKERMIRNHLHFAYAEVGTSKIIGGDWTFVAEKDSGLRIKEFITLLEAYLSNTPTGLYCRVRNSDGFRGKCDWDVYFEEESDLDAFVKDFLVLHKLSN